MVLTAPTLAAVLIAIIVGAVLQRLSGTGMGLVLAPILTLILGAGPGVLVANGTTFMSAVLMSWPLRRDIEWRRALLINACAVPGIIAGALLVKHLPAAWLQICVGGIVLLAVVVTAVAGALGKLPTLSGWWLTPTAGLLGGVFNAMAGVAAPVLVVHSRLTRWRQAGFAATMQPVFAWMGLCSVLTKSALGSSTALPPWWLVPVVLATVILGIVLGGAAAKRVTAAHARTLAVTLAALGGLSALVRGIVTLVG